MLLASLPFPLVSKDCRSAQTYSKNWQFQKSSLLSTVATSCPPTSRDCTRPSILESLISTRPVTFYLVSNTQVIVQTQTLHVVRVDADFAHKCRRSEELHFDALFGYEVVGSGETGGWWWWWW
jgi:hypothetical protein